MDWFLYDRDLRHERDKWIYILSVKCNLTSRAILKNLGNREKLDSFKNLTKIWKILVEEFLSSL